ncbi:hypothetical protein ACFW9D_18695 [Streptomyces sp. NPDC059524]|uniref:hypothetical protein n=1 Tax=Streptomyces sp. NPDC059524 TaxID=3346856 RepID=UPI0036BACC5E
MTLAVEADPLDEYASLVCRAGDDCSHGLTYLDSNARIGFSVSGDAWNLAVGDHAEKVRQATDVLSRLGMILRDAETELRTSASWYRTVDPRRARALDAARFQAGTGAPVIRAVPDGRADFRDVRDASVRLERANGRTGRGRRDVTWMVHDAHAGTLLSAGIPSEQAHEGLRLAFEFDVIGTVAEWLTGDWLKYIECADTWLRLGDLCADVAENLRHGNEVLGTSWRGSAADAAWTHFERIADRLETARDAFHSQSEHYAEVTEAVFSFAEFVNGAVSMLCEEAVEAACAAAASPSEVAPDRKGSFDATVAQRVAAMVTTYDAMVQRYESLMLDLTTLLTATGTATRERTGRRALR